MMMGRSERERGGDLGMVVAAVNIFVRTAGFALDEVATMPAGGVHGTAAVVAAVSHRTMPSRTRLCSHGSVSWLRVKGIPFLRLGAMVSA